MEADVAQGDPPWNAMGIHVSYRCALPKPHGTGFPKAVGDGLWGAPLFWTVWNHSRVKVEQCWGFHMPGDNSGWPGVIPGFSGGIYGWDVFQRGGTWMFSCELAFNVGFGKCCMNLKVLVDLSPHLPYTAYSKQRWELLQICENIFYVRSENVVGNLHLEDVESGVLEQKIPLICPPNSAFEGLLNQGAHTKYGIPHWDASACTLQTPYHFSGDFQDRELGIVLPEQRGSWSSPITQWGMKTSLSVPLERLFGLDLEHCSCQVTAWLHGHQGSHSSGGCWWHHSVPSKEHLSSWLFWSCSTLLLIRQSISLLKFGEKSCKKSMGLGGLGGLFCHDLWFSSKAT